MPDSAVFNLFASCIPVKGAKKSIICDVHRGRFRYIPDALYYILTHFKKHTIAEVKEKFEHRHDAVIEEYFDFLEKNEFIFYCTKEEQKLFPKLKFDFEFPSTITNCIIDFDENSDYDYAGLFRQLSDLNCNYWQLRFFGTFTTDAVYTILCAAEGLTVSSIHLVLPYNSSVTKIQIDKIYQSAPVAQIDFYGVPENKIGRWKKMAERLPFYFYPEMISDQTHCGKISPDYFALNINTFGESHSFNNCLNRKIGVDAKGNIKNCPSMQQHYGNVRDTTLEKVLKNAAFKYIWTVTKDQIEVCKGCEFRYICTDCRAYREDPENMYSKPLKCGYDPHTNKWESWSKNPLKKPAIEHYRLNII